MRNKRIKIVLNEKIKLIFLMVLMVISIVITSLGVNFVNVTKTINANANYLAYTNNGFVYLSDLDYLTTAGMSQNGWDGHSIQKDKNQDGGSLSLIVEGEKRTYIKGLSIHGRGWATYDVSELSTEYSRFTARLGVDASRDNKGSLFFRIYASTDAITWDTLLETGILTGTSEAVDVDVNIEGYNYLRIYVDPNGSNASDHGTIANAKLVTADYENKEFFYDKVHKLDYYDEILREHDGEYNYENNYRTILEREVVNKIGYWNIQTIAEFTPEVIDTFDWILSDNRILEEVIEVGEISKPTVFMEVLSNLYHNFKDDLKKEDGLVYEKMMIGLAAAYSTDTIASPLIYGHTLPNYDYLARYSRVKQLFEEDKFLHTDWFKEYHVEFMRSIMQDALRDDETMWFSNYVRVIKNDAMGPYSYMGYVKGNFVLPAYFEESNKANYDKKYHLSEFNVPYGDSPTARYWMVFEHGGICWNLARTGQSVQKTLGLPSTGVFQPSHEAFLLYTKDSQGRGFWYLGNNNHGWGRSSTTWYGGKPYRLLFNWGKKSFVNHASTASAGGTNSGYQYLAQANLNRYDEFKKSLYLNLVANSYINNEEKVATYKKALESMELNLDSYDYLIQIYKKMDSITDKDWYNLALQIIDVYTFYPQAMYDLLNVIKPYLSGPDVIDVSIKERAALERASHATNADIWQDLAARELANVHLGKTQENIASFSFDGEEAGKIVINPAYNDYDFGWHYSLDGGQTKSEQIVDHSFQLTKEEVAEITAENDIRIYIDGMPGDALAYIIDIGVMTLPNTLYKNDLENRVVGVGLNYEWRNSDDEEWTSYKDASPNNTGDKVLQVRIGATGDKLPSETEVFTFTEDNQPNTRKYVPVSHLSIHAYSTQSHDSKRPYYAPNAIDGNGNTFWHTDYAQNVLNSTVKPFITIKLDKPRYISALEFKQAIDPKRPTDPDLIKNARIYVSEDGENWALAGQIENHLQDKELKIINFGESIYGEYVKIEMDTYNMFASLSLVNIFQDLTKNPRPTAGIGYSTTLPTRENVVARLVNISATNYEITSAGGDTHVFTEEGPHSFTFTFIDKDTGLTGSSVATVDWIDRTAPIATIEYSKSTATNSTVVATLKANEEVRVTNNGGYTVDEEGNVYNEDGNKLDGYTIDKNGDLKDNNGNIVANINTFTHDFNDNGEFTFEFIDRAGNKGAATAKVTWIDHDIPEATLTYNKVTLTNQNVTVTAKFDEDVIVTNNGGSHSYTFTKNGEFTFEFQDLAGNMNKTTAKVDWIDKIAPTAELKYEKVGDTIIVYVVNASKNITFQNGNGIYEFTKNGNYDIVFFDELGNKGKVTAVITGFAKDQDGTSKPDDNGNTGNIGNQDGNNSGNNGSQGNNGNSSDTNIDNMNKGDNNIGNDPIEDNSDEEKKPDIDEKDPITDDDIENKTENETTQDMENANPFHFNSIIVVVSALFLITGIGMIVLYKVKYNQ